MMIIFSFVVDRYTLSIPSESNSFAFEKKTARAFVLVKSPEYELIVGSFGAFAQCRRRMRRKPSSRVVGSADWQFLEGEPVRRKDFHLQVSIPIQNKFGIFYILEMFTHSTYVVSFEAGTERGYPMSDSTSI